MSNPTYSLEMLMRPPHERLHSISLEMVDELESRAFVRPKARLSHIIRNVNLDGGSPLAFRDKDGSLMGVVISLAQWKKLYELEQAEELS